MFVAFTQVATTDVDTLVQKAELHFMSAEVGRFSSDVTEVTFTSDHRGRLSAFLYLFIFDGDVEAVEAAITEVN